MSCFAYFLAVWTGAFIWPQEFRSKPADMGTLRHAVIRVLIPPAWLPAPVGRTPEMETWAALPAAYDSPEEPSEPEKRVSSSSASKASLP